MRDTTIRLASRADALCLHALATQVFLETYATSGIREALAREVRSHFSEAAFLRLIEEPGIHILLAEREGHIVAFAEVQLGATHELVGDAPAAELNRLYVQSPFLRRSIGRSLLRAAEACASDSGASTLWLTAWVGNTRALAFYASQGYRELGVTQYEFENEQFENRLFARMVRADT
ncbi:MAG: GNAT family N-acetyltransferase [Caldimonas sp.]